LRSVPKRDQEPPTPNGAPTFLYINPPPTTNAVHFSLMLLLVHFLAQDHIIMVLWWELAQTPPSGLLPQQEPE